jgi:hypothetical protein
MGLGSKGHKRPAVGHSELSDQRSDVALHGPYRDVEPLGDLRIGQVVAHQVQYLGLPLGELLHHGWRVLCRKAL